MSASVWTSGTTTTPSLPAVAPVQFVLGTKALPGITFVGDTNTGMYSTGDGVVAITSNGEAQVVINSSGVEIPAGTLKLSPEATIASAATCNIGAIQSNSMTVTGSATIGSLGTTYSGPKFLRFTGAAVLNYSANLILPGAASITAAPGDCAIFIPKATAGVSDGWVCVSYQYGNFAAARNLLGVYSTTEADTAISAAINVANASIGGFRNVVMNGNMAISQEFGTASTTITAGAVLKYAVDGWYAACTGANVTVQQVITNNKVSLVVTGLAANTGVTLGHRIESADSYSMAGLFATLSLLVSSSALTAVNWGLYYANTKDAFGTIAVPTRTLIQTGSFTGVTSTATLKSAITSAALAAGAHTGLEIVFTTGALLGAQTLTITDVQLEKGSIANPVFENLEAPRQLARCDRAFRPISSLIGVFASATNLDWHIPHKGMRVAPTPTTSAALSVTDSVAANYTQSSGNISLTAADADGGRYQSTNFTGATAGRVAILLTAGGKIFLSARL